jgi:hypothetical protein
VPTDRSPTLNFVPGDYGVGSKTDVVEQLSGIKTEWQGKCGIGDPHCQGTSAEEQNPPKGGPS